jgi:hypothetical protein
MNTNIFGTNATSPGFYVVRQTRAWHLRYTIPRFAFFLIFAFVTTPIVFAGSATWNADATSSDWDDAANWTPETVPNGPGDVASFGPSNQTAISFSTDIEVAEIIFNPGAGSFAITAGPATTLTISGTGVTNNSGIEQNFW